MQSSDALSYWSNALANLFIHVVGMKKVGSYLRGENLDAKTQKRVLAWKRRHGLPDDYPVFEDRHG